MQQNAAQLHGAMVAQPAAGSSCWQHTLKRMNPRWHKKGGRGNASCAPQGMGNWL